MTEPGPASYKVVNHAEKREALKLFVAAAAARLDASTSAVHTAPTLIARTWESPAAQALLGAPASLFTFGAPRIIFTRLPDNTSLPSLPDVMSQSVDRQFRLLSDPRLLDAHEQLVLSSTCCWIGDCMRRDPMKRDAFEKFSEACAKTAAIAATSFEHLWRIAKPIRSDALVRRAAVWSKPTDGADSVAATAVAGEPIGERPAGLASTRH